MSSQCIAMYVQLDTLLNLSDLPLPVCQKQSRILPSSWHLMMSEADSRSKIHRRYVVENALVWHLHSGQRCLYLINYWGVALLKICQISSAVICNVYEPKTLIISLEWHIWDKTCWNHCDWLFRRRPVPKDMLLAHMNEPEDGKAFFQNFEVKPTCN